MAIDIGKGFVTVVPKVDTAAFAAGVGSAFRGINKGVASQALKTGAVLTAGITLPVLALGKAAFNASRDFESALAGVAKTVGDVTSIADPLIVKLGEDIEEIAKVTPLAAEELLRIGEIAGQLGVAAENIPEFATKVAQIAISTDLTSEAAAFSLARFANVLGDGTDAVGEYGDAIVNLGNNFPTTESQILSLSSRIAGAGATVGIEARDILSIATALSSVGVTSELGGTAIQRIIVSIASEVAEGGEKLELFAKTAGQSAEDFATAWANDPANALVGFIQGLGRMQEQGGPLFKTLDDLGFGAVRVQQVLLRAAGASDLFTGAMDTAADSAGALQVEVNKRFSTTESRIEVMSNNIQAAFRDFGDAALPIVKVLADGVSFLAQAITNLPGPLKVALGLFALLAAAVGPILLVVGGIAQAAASFALYRAATAGAAAATQAQTGASTALTSALGGQTLAAQRAATANVELAASSRAASFGGRAGGQFITPAAGGGFTSAFTKPGRIAAGFNKLRPSFQNVGKGLGVAFGASIAAGVVNSIETEEQTIQRSAQTVVSSALTGAGLGGLIGSVFPVVGTALGAGVGGALGATFGLIKQDLNSFVGEVEISSREIINIFDSMGLEVKNSVAQFKIFSGLDDEASELASSLSPIVTELLAINQASGFEGVENRIREISFAFVTAQDPSRSPEDVMEDLQTLLFNIDQFTPNIRFNITPEDASNPRKFVEGIQDGLVDLQAGWDALTFGERSGPVAELGKERKAWEVDVASMVQTLGNLGEAQGFGQVADLIDDMNKSGLVTEGTARRIFEELSEFVVLNSTLGEEGLGLFNRDDIDTAQDFLDLMYELGFVTEGLDLTGDAQALELLPSGGPTPEEVVEDAEAQAKAMEEAAEAAEKYAQARIDLIEELRVAVPTGATSFDLDFSFPDAQEALDNFNTAIGSVADNWVTTLGGLDIDQAQITELTRNLSIPARAEFIDIPVEEQQAYVDSLTAGMEASNLVAHIDADLIVPEFGIMEEFNAQIEQAFIDNALAPKVPVDFDHEAANTAALALHQQLQIDLATKFLTIPINFAVGPLPPLPNIPGGNVFPTGPPANVINTTINNPSTSNLTRDQQKAAQIIGFNLP